MVSLLKNQSKFFSVFLLIIGAITVSAFSFQRQYLQAKQLALVEQQQFSFDESFVSELDPYAWLQDWVRPPGPPRVGLQVGHWKNNELPEELSRLIGNTGASGGGKAEWEVNYAIAEEIRKILENQGIIVDILPSTVPEKYFADVFIAIHADGSTNTSATGFKIAGPRRDFSGKSDELISSLEQVYDTEIDLPKDPNITRNMRGYYAFSWSRYKHAIHPMTTAAIVETGFLTNPKDRTIIVDQPELPAQALATGILNFLQTEGLMHSKQES